MEIKDVRITDNSDKVNDAVRGAAIKYLTEAGLFIAGEAQQELEANPRRIDTGNLRNSITSQVVEEELAAYIGTNVEYAIYVHEGTSKMEPNRFLKNAIDRNQDQLKQKWKQALENA